MDMFKQLLYFFVLIFLCLHFAHAEPCRKAVYPVHATLKTALRMAHHKEFVEFKRPSPVVLPPLPRTSSTTTSTTTEPLPKQVQEVLRQLNGSEFLKYRENYDLLLIHLKKHFTTTKLPAKTRAYTLFV